jgi:hypothetical protein
MAVEKVIVAPEFIGLDSRERIVTRAPLRPYNTPSQWTFRRAFGALFKLIMLGSEVMAEAHQLRREAERRYPHISFDA